MKVTSTVESLLNPVKTKEPKGKNDLGKQDFLLLLVTQLKHQNPLNPVAGHEFVAQLAQFSSLEELENIGKNIEESVKADKDLNNTINKNTAVNLIGKSLKADSNVINHKSINGTEDLGFVLDDFAKEVKVIITDTSGSVVNVIIAENLEKGINKLEWDGKNIRGEKVINGEYHFTVDARNSEDEIVGAHPFITGKITGVKFKNDETYFIVNGTEVPLSSVTEIIDVD
ncbi:hypothetical protein DRQ09_06445 [candidate division KSB1 bacterium]|nr:MAG: hypothetical protein DRQ09_06445 [candidate division KSB1 bacterium]